MRPNFSGEWILNRQASALSPGADAIQSAVVRIEHHDPQFKYQSKFVSDTGTAEPAFELMTEERDDAPLRWDGEALVFTYADAQMSIIFRYELIDEGRRLQAVETLRSSGHNQDNVWIFDRNNVEGGV